MRALDLAERQLGADEGPEGAGLPEAEQLADCGADELGREPEQTSEIEAGDRDVPADEEAGIRLRPRTGGRPDGDQRAERLQATETGGEEVAADRVDDHVHAQVVRKLSVDVG